MVKRALEVAAAGGHNVLMSGPPGSGKTLLARSMPSILPRMTPSEALDVTRIYSVAGMLPSDVPLIRHRPFRAPHHTISNAGLVGGGQWPRPGEISLAHRGVLFLDEMPEFGQHGLEVLRQPLEDKVVTISRAQGSLTFPANFMLVGAQNPCPCGFFGDPEHACTCSPMLISRYQKRLSGPLLDRIDIHVEVPRVPFQKLSDERRGEPSAAIRARVEAARPADRAVCGRGGWGGVPPPLQQLTTNADMGPTQVRDFCPVDETGRQLLAAAMRQMNLSARACYQRGGAKNGQASHSVRARETGRQKLIDVQRFETNLASLCEQFKPQARSIRENAVRQHHQPIVAKHLNGSAINKDLQADHTSFGLQVSRVDACKVFIEATAARVRTIYEHLVLQHIVANRGPFLLSNAHFETESVNGRIQLKFCDNLD